MIALPFTYAEEYQISASPESCLLLQLGYLSTQASLAKEQRSAGQGQPTRTKMGRILSLG